MTLERLQAALAAVDHLRIAEVLAEVPPADRLEMVEQLEPAERERLISSLSGEELAEILQEMELDSQAEFLGLIEVQRAVEIVEEMDPDDSADLLVHLGPAGQEIMEQLEDDLKNLMSYGPETAGGLMTPEVMALCHTLTVDEAIREIRNQAPGDVETVYYAYVVDEARHLMGVLSLRDLLVSPGKQPIAEVMRDRIISVKAHEDQEAVAGLLEKYDFLALPVTDDQGVLLGIVTVDDLIDVVEAETTEDIYKQAGLHAEGGVSPNLSQASIMTILRARLPWLLLALLGGFMAGGVIEFFEESLGSIVFLAFFIPVIMDMGGNVGTQSSTIFVRGLVLGHVPLDRFGRFFLREVGVGIAIGLTIGSIAGVIAAIWQGVPQLGIVIGLSMAITCSLATSLGCGIPWLIYKLGKDPATASDPLITTIKDVTGLMIYFVMARVFLSHLF